MPCAQKYVGIRAHGYAPIVGYLDYPAIFRYEGTYGSVVEEKAPTGVRAPPGKAFRPWSRRR